MTDDNVTDFPTPKSGKPKRPSSPARQAHFDKLGHAPAGGHQASGPGWGGPAKGAGQAYGVKGGKGGRMKEGPERQRIVADKKAAAEELTARLVAMGLNNLTEVDETTGEEVKVDVPLTLQHSAIVSSLDRLEGKSLTRVAATPNGETVEELRVDPTALTDEQLAAIASIKVLPSR